METKMIGSKIALARKKNNLSQAQLAAQLFISPQAVGKWERGESVPDILTIGRIAAILDVDLNYFAGDTVQPAQPKETEHGNRLPDPTDERLLHTGFSGSDLAGSDFAGVKAHKRKFYGSALAGADFSGADLSGSSFRACDAQAACFDKANLTDCTLSATRLSGASFDKTILLRTRFSTSDLAGARFSGVQFRDVQLAKTDLRRTLFENCHFSGVDFSASDLSGLCLDGQAFTGVRFDKTALNGVSFKGATLLNISFRSPLALTNKYYRALQTVCFDGAQIDKLSYAALKGLGVDLSKATAV
ncbi:MAG: pentapeptide repeat-containing protein [Chitinophagaceae bacterium]|nr:pentapeptide repeat-containing protein [Chitinophagaceae bacterium]